MSQPIEPSRPTVLDPTYARPEPWFVGNGRGLMIAVLLLVAIVLALRGVTTWWALEDAWRWWQSRPAPLGDTPPETVPEPAAPLPVPPVPPADARLGSRGPVGNAGSAFGPDSYPAEALRGEQQGRTVAQLLLGANGVPQRCTILISSEHQVLDRRTCEIALARVRYTPARDERGRPIPATVRLPVRWQSPDQ